MKIFTLRAHVNHYRNLVPDQEKVLEQYRAFDGTALAEGFLPIQVEPGEQADLPWSDFPGLTSHIPVFSPHAVTALHDLLTGNGQFVPLVCPACPEPFQAFNVTRLVDVLDVENSEVKRFRSGRIMRVLRYSFHEERLADLTIFKIPEEPLKMVFVTRDFVRRVQNKGLTGFRFQLLATSEGALLLCPYCWGLIEETTHYCPSCGLDVTNDALIEMTPEEYRQAERSRCLHCHARVLPLSDPCPYCGKGKRRQRATNRPVVIT
ncbi:MAG: imm11 family protein [Anaerolineae bacterium]